MGYTATNQNHVLALILYNLLNLLYVHRWCAGHGKRPKHPEFTPHPIVPLPPIARLLVGRTLSLIGSNLTQKALPILLLSFGQGTALAGNVAAIAILPSVLSAPLLGVWAEKNHPRVLTLLNLAFIIASTITALGFNDKSVTTITAGLLLVKTIDAAYTPLYSRCQVAFTPLDRESHIGQLQSVFGRLASAIGSGAAPALTQTIGFWVYTIDAISFALTALMMRAMPDIESFEPHPAPTASSIQQLILGTCQAWQSINKPMLCFLLMAFANWTTESFVLPSFKAVSPNLLGAFYATKAISGGLTAIWCMVRHLRYTNALLAFGGCFLGASSVALYTVGVYGSWMVPGAVVFGGMGSSIIGSGVTNRLLYADRTTTARVAALVNTASKVAEMLFTLVATRTADAFGAPVVLLAVAALMVTTTVVVFAFIKPTELNVLER